MKYIVTILLLLISFAGYSQLESTSQNKGLKSMGGEVGIHSNQSGIPFQSDLLSNYNRRSGNWFYDDLNGDSAEILIPDFLSNGTVTIQGNKTRISEHFWDGTDYTLYFRMKQVNAVTGSNTYEIFNTGTSGRAINFRFQNQYLRLYYGDSVLTTQTIVLYSTLNGLLTYDYVDILVQIKHSSGDSIKCWLYAPDESAITTIGKSISTITFSSNPNAANLTFANNMSVVTNWKKFTGLKTITQCLQDSYNTNLQIHYPNIYSVTDISGNGNHLTRSAGFNVPHKYYTSMNMWLLNYGYQEYQRPINDSLERMYVSYKQNGDTLPIDWTSVSNYLTGRRIVGEFPASESSINMMDCKLRFNNEFFNRKSTVIWGDSARSATTYYSATDTMTFHISELNQRTLSEWLNDGYRGKVYVKMNDNSIERWDRKLLTNIFLYNTDHKTTQNAKILTYTGDIFARAIDSTYDHNNYVKLGYFQSDSAMLTFRIDDGDNSVIGGWNVMFDTFNIKPIIGIHAAEMGTNGTYEYLTWEQVDSLVSEGWELADHVDNEIDLNNTENLDSIEIRMRNAQQLTLDSIGYTLEYFIGNRYSSANASVMYFSNKVGYKAHLGWGTINSLIPNGTNNKELDIYWVATMAADLGGSYQLEDADNSQEIAAIKAQLDLCKATGRWGLLFVHAWGQKVSDAIANEIIVYAIANDIGIVSFTDGYNQCKYLSK
ncbi:MAG: hypothetical protein M0P71_16575 [Melioribacteraceae bacterium]|jgi:hypothetical protein|nr:hypothetical protein [Melioribacteraceae bacterium]